MLLPLAIVLELLTVPAVADRGQQIVDRLDSKTYRYVQVDQHGRPVDRITVVHEGLHMLNGRLSRPGWHGLYIGGGVAVRVRKPKGFRLRLLRPRNTSRYRIYVVNASRWWDDDPLYLADEALAYLAGSRMRRDAKIAGRSETITNGIELTEMYREAIDIVRRVDPGYDTSGMLTVLEYLEAGWEEFRWE